jgi:sigma-B regulation protein RsbU (phosphoserine phosphatase)
MIGDVTGHGVGSAMVSAVAHGAMTAVLASLENFEKELNLSILLNLIDHSINIAARGEMYMTCFAFFYNPSSKKIQYANAGHNFPIHIDAQTKQLKELSARGDILGRSDSKDYVIKEKSVNEDDCFIFYTDGITEATNETNEMYGLRNLKKAIKTVIGLPLIEASNHIITEVSEFSHHQSQEDDITLVMLKIGQ